MGDSDEDSDEDNKWIQFSTRDTGTRQPHAVKTKYGVVQELLQDVTTLRQDKQGLQNEVDRLTARCAELENQNKAINEIQAGTESPELDNLKQKMVQLTQENDTLKQENDTLKQFALE